MPSAIITVLVFLVAWTVAWYGFLRRYLMQYTAIAGVIDRVEAAEGDAWTQVKIWLEGKKALIVAFVASAFGAGKAAVDSTVSVAASLTPTDVAPLHDPNIWHAFFSDGWVMRIMSGLTILTAVLAVRGHVVAAKIEPKV